MKSEIRYFEFMESETKHVIHCISEAIKGFLSLL